MTKNEINSCIKKGLEIWATRNDVERWLNQPCHNLDNRKPIDCTIKEVYSVIMEIEYGFNK